MITSFKRTSLLTIASLFTTLLWAQTEDAPNGWHLLDSKQSGYYGISLNKAYEFLKEKKAKSKTVIVAVIDSGIDTTHEDLKSILWVNPKETPGNGIDDDKNGYVDDVHGWNFLGSTDGKENVEKDSYEFARFYHLNKSKWSGKDIDANKLSTAEKYEYETWLRAQNEIATGNGEERMSSQQLYGMKKAFETISQADSILRKAMNKSVFTGTELKEFQTNEVSTSRAKEIFLSILEANSAIESSNTEFLEGFGDYVNKEVSKAEMLEKAPENYRSNIVNDNYKDFSDKFYGNNNVLVNNKSAMHGTHVAGLIAAVRNNGKGIDGIADNVRIMAIRAVPDGDEHDKDIALSIRYAVDNGAKVINMSFGKDYSPEKYWVDDAVKYAEEKGVLLVHAAGNDAKNIDTGFNFPSPVYLANGKKASNWINVGANGPNNEEGNSLTASFSNYGKKEVDVFAPGVKIYSTVPGSNTYKNLQGTSFSSPIVAGLAALIFEYFPNLSPQQVKFVIEKSATPIKTLVGKPGTTDEVSFSNLSKSGAIVNAYQAVKLASTLKPEKVLKTKPAKSVIITKPKS